MKKKGFTLVELLAVIVILAVITLIATPMILNVIEESKKGAIRSSVNGIVEAANLYYTQNLDKGVLTNSVIDLRTKTINYKGKIDKGSLVFNDNGEIKVVISDSKYCAYKNYGTNDILLGKTEDEFCNVSGTMIGLNTLEIGEAELHLMVSSTDSVPTGTGLDNEIKLISSVEVSNYLISNVEPTTKTNGTVWIEIDIDSKNYISMENTYIPIGSLYQYDGTKWQSRDAYIYNNGSWNKFSSEIYQEEILNGAYPVIKENLIPVTLSNTGEVTYADINSKWYSYENKVWANAVILVDTPSKTYNVGDTILESDIESYFVWIPRYKYRLWNTGTAIKNAHEIEIVFENKNTAASTGSNNGEWLTHPAFTSFDSNGMWVGKFETGYNGATSASTAQVNSNDASKIVIKPNVYSWRNITVGNIFTAAYNYERNLDSHMMKNTEWGAVAYLSHSKYGINTEVNINNNSSYKTGYSALPSTNQQTYPGTYGDGATYNEAYNTEIGYLASTTGNISGVYDMSGGAHEYVAGYISGNVGSSGLTVANYDSKYFDVYSTSSSVTSYQYRILGDATGEMGPFKSYADGDGTARYHNSWYADNSYFVDSSYPWFYRGGGYAGGVLAGTFDFYRYTGGAYTNVGFRLVLS